MNWDQDDGNDSDVGNNYEILPELKRILPSVDTLRRARKHGWFKQVTHKKADRHARCRTCANLKGDVTHGWHNKTDVDLFKKRLLTHGQETRKWRDLEAD